MIKKADWDKAWPMLVKKTNVSKMLDEWAAKCPNPSTLKSNEAFETARSHATALNSEFERAKDKLSKSHVAADALITDGKKAAEAYLKVVTSSQEKWAAVKLNEVAATVQGAVDTIERGRERLRAAASLVKKRQAETAKFERDIKAAQSLGERVAAKAGLQKTLEAIEVILAQAPVVGNDVRRAKAVEAVRGPGVAGVISRAGLSAEQGKAMAQDFNRNMSAFVAFEDELRALVALCALARSEVETVMSLNVRGIDEVEGAIDALTKLAPNAKASCDALSKMLKLPPQVLTDNEPATVVGKFKGDSRMVVSQLQIAEDLVASVSKQVPALRAFIDGALKKIPPSVHQQAEVELLMDQIMDECDKVIKEAGHWKANMRPIVAAGHELVRAFEAARKK